MEPLIEQKPTAFVDRRQTTLGQFPDAAERRQFSNSYETSRSEVVELAEAIDQYKLCHRRRFITFEELFDVMTGLGYHK